MRADSALCWPSGWQLRQPMPDVLPWRTPLGHRYLVTPSRTVELGRAVDAAPDPEHALAA